MKHFTLVLLSIAYAISALAQAKYTDVDKKIFGDYCSKFSTLSNLPYTSLIVKTALYFKDKPYVVGSLENESKETVVVNFREFDCTTFDETVFALVITLKGKDCSFERYSENLESIRYRNGKCTDYPSRLHYFSDWIYDNKQRNNIVDINQSMGGVPIKFKVGFMSKNPDKYKHLADRPNFVEQIQAQEESINLRDYFYLPKNKLSEYEKKIKDGDIIAIVTTTPGLDISHVGLAYHQKGKLYFIHASQKYKKVLVNPETLQDYLNQAKSRKGIMVARISERKI